MLSREKRLRRCGVDGESTKEMASEQVEAVCDPKMILGGDTAEKMLRRACWMASEPVQKVLEPRA